MKNILALVFVFVFCNFTGNRAVNDDQQAALIFKALKPFPQNTQFAIAIIENGSARFFGAKRIADTVTRVDNHQQIFEIGSITKVFTSTLLAALVREKKINLDGNIASHLEWPLKDSSVVSFQQLANHTSGLPRLPTNLNLFGVDQNNPYRDYDEAKLKQYLTVDMVLPRKPGEKYEYSNLGAGLLGYLVSRIDKKSYEDMLKQRIFLPYKMQSSTTVRSNVETKLVKGQNAMGEEVSNWDLNALVGAGGILSSAEDLSKFSIAQFNDKDATLKLTRTKTFDVNDNLSLGLGWHLIRKDGKEWCWHNGGTGGYLSSMAIDPKKKTGIVILSNVSAFHKDARNIDALCFALMETLR